MQDFKYLLKEDEVKRVWHENQTLADFYMSGTAERNIKYLVNDYFDRLPPRFDKMKKNVIDLSTLVIRAFDHLLQMMKRYHESVAIDGDFVR
jgi:predicted Zn-dependent protease with MMP-like domain